MVSVPVGHTDTGRQEVINLGIGRATGQDEDAHFRLYIENYSAVSDDIKLGSLVNPTSSKNNWVNTPLTDSKIPVNSYIDVAFSMLRDEAEDEVSTIVYLSTDNGKTWNLYSRTVSDGDSLSFSEIAYVKLGGGSKGINLEFDDIKFYNKALTENQIKLQSKGAIFHGVQTTAKDSKDTEDAADDTVDVRFVASIDSINYKAVGFNISANNGAQTWNDPVDAVYSKLLGSVEVGGEKIVEEYTAANVRGGAAPYLYALCIKGVPAVGTVTFIVKPYYVDLNNVTPVYGVGYEITFTDGVYVSASVYTESTS